MNPLFLFWLSLGGMFGEPSLPERNPPLGFQRFDNEAWHRQHLDRVRRSIVMMHDMLEWMDTWGRGPELQEFLAEVKDGLQRLKEEERELTLWWFMRRLKPGPKTDREAIERLRKIDERGDARLRGSLAPMPRVAKKSASGP
jgi:hypothetical protein